MNLIDWKGDLRVAFYKSSRKHILYLGEEKQKECATENNGVEPLSLRVWHQNLRRCTRAINNCNFHREKFIKIKTSETCKIRGILEKTGWIHEELFKFWFFR